MTNPLSKYSLVSKINSTRHYSFTNPRLNTKDIPLVSQPSPSIRRNRLYNFESSSIFQSVNKTNTLSLSPDFASQVCEGVDRARIETVTDTPETLLTQSGKKYGQSKESGPPVTFVLRFITVAPHHLLRSSSSFSRFPPSSPILCNSVATLL